MKVGYFNGAMYVKLEGEKIEVVSVELGDKTLHPGQYVSKLGEEKRTSFEMNDGWYLKYVGKVEDYILFDVNSSSLNIDNYYYAFAYVNKNTLLVQGSPIGFWDIRLKSLDIFDEVKMQYLDEQLSLF